MYICLVLLQSKKKSGFKWRRQVVTQAFLQGELFMICLPVTVLSGNECVRLAGW